MAQPGKRELLEQQVKSADPIVAERAQAELDKMGDAINHPAHYGGADNPYEAIKVIEAWDLNFRTGNAVKYISRAGKKDPDKEIEDLEKAKWYLDREISKKKEERDGVS